MRHSRLWTSTRQLQQLCFSWVDSKGLLSQVQLWNINSGKTFKNKFQWRMHSDVRASTIWDWFLSIFKIILFCTILKTNLIYNQNISHWIRLLTMRFLTRLRFKRRRTVKLVDKQPRIQSALSMVKFMLTLTKFPTKILAR